MSKAVALFVYRRPHRLKQILEKIGEYKPVELFVFADGPNNSEEKEMCEKTRSEVNQFAFDFIVTKHYSDYNKGLSANILEGISIVFEKYDSAVFIEDDCIPTLSFFHFCEYGLNAFFKDESVFQISAAKWLDIELKGPLKSQFTLPSWGWASWRHKWNRFNSNYNTFRNNPNILKGRISDENLSIWERACSSLNIGNRDSWDLQWQLDVWNNDGYALLPPQNLITNEGNFESASYNPDTSKFSFSSKEIANSDLGQLRLISPVEQNHLEKVLTAMISGFIEANQSSFAISRQIIKREVSFVNGLYPISINDLKEKLKVLPSSTFFGESFFQDLLLYLNNKQYLFIGNWLQIGAWKGGSTAIFAGIRRDMKSKGRLIVMDTFGTIPVEDLKQEKDLQFVEAFKIGSHISSYKNEVEKKLGDYGFNENDYELVEEDISSVKNHSAFKRMYNLIFIDVDFYEPTFASLNNAYHCLEDNGIIIIDDYYSPIFNCKEAVDKFFQVNDRFQEVSFRRFSENAVIIEKKGL